MFLIHTENGNVEKRQYVGTQSVCWYPVSICKRQFRYRSYAEVENECRIYFMNKSLWHLKQDYSLLDGDVDKQHLSVHTDDSADVGRSQEVQKKIKQAQLKMLESNKKIRDLAINIK